MGGGGRPGPLAELLAMRERLTQFLEVRVERDGRAGGAAHVADVSSWSPQVDAVERDGVFSVVVEVPGVEASGLKVSVKNNALVVEGARTMGARRGKLAAAAVLSVERATGAFQRVIPLPVPVRRESVP
ncbi:MAG: Hsp20/alpha crystallin family protein [Deltaproteobacteria bacterium]|nr:Hsp20/alpha crystallin family protein [Deltaproteobacteria bacterium]